MIYQTMVQNIFLNYNIMMTKKKYLENAATKILKTYERFDKLKEIAKKDPKKEIKVAKFK